MNKDKAQQHISACLNDGDDLIGFFQAIEPPKIWLFFLLGPLAILSMKSYFVAVGEQGVYFHRLNLLGKADTHDFFSFDEIEHLKVGNGVLQRPMWFSFNNGRKIKIKGQLKGVEKVAKLTPEVQAHLEKQISSVS